MEINLNIDEKQLIQKLFELEESLHIIELKKLGNNNSIEHNRILEEEKQYKSEADQIISLLKHIEKPLASIDIWYNLISAFTQMQSIIKNNKFDYPISRSQGYIFHDYFVSIILYEIHKIIILGNFGISRPFLNLTTDPKDSIDKKVLINFFVNEIRVLKQLTISNYFDVRAYFETFRIRLMKLIEV